MKNIFPFFVVGLFFCATAFAENPPWKNNETGTIIQARADLDVRWETAAKFPGKVWTYQLLPNNFSPEIISNVAALCSFTEKDLSEHRLNGVDFRSNDGSRKLSISFPSGEIHYEATEPHYNPTNLAVGVPKESELPALTTNVLRKLRINFTDIVGWIGTNKIDYTAGGRTYFIGDTTITNITYRRVYFRRSVEGIPIVGGFQSFNVGEHGKVSALSIVWPKLERIKSYPTISRSKVIECLRKGDAMRGPVPMNVLDPDWSRIKSVTIKKAVPSYLVNNNRLYPFLRLDAAIDTGHEIVVVGIDCPIIDETKL